MIAAGTAEILSVLALARGAAGPGIQGFVSWSLVFLIACSTLLPAASFLGALNRTKPVTAQAPGAGKQPDGEAGPGAERKPLADVPQTAQSEQERRPPERTPL